MVPTKGNPTVNGPEHFAEAERLLNEVGNKGVDTLTQIVATGSFDNFNSATATLANTVAVAQVHATLALAAATADANRQAVSA